MTIEKLSLFFLNFETGLIENGIIAWHNAYTY